MSESNPVVATYLTTVAIPGIPKEFYSDFNIGWGFEGGAVNKLDEDGSYSPLPGAEGGGDHQKAFHTAISGTRAQLKVEVFKDGTKRVSVVPAPQEPRSGKPSGKRPRRTARS